MGDGGLEYLGFEQLIPRRPLDLRLYTSIEFVTYRALWVPANVSRSYEILLSLIYLQDISTIFPSSLKYLFLKSIKSHRELKKEVSRLNNSENSIIGEETKLVISKFVASSVGLKISTDVVGVMTIQQRVDGKTITISEQKIEEVLERIDTDGRAFLQVNFTDGKKILLTEKLVGFKPAITEGLDLQKLPRVVTTPDLVSVVEAIEESLNSKRPRFEEVEVLRRVFDSVLLGAQEVGFDLEAERAWISCIASVRGKATA